jgi:tetratricopeptide (TPR) repeat protein
MIEALVENIQYPMATAGDIAVVNLESARLQSWSRFWQSPQRTGIAEYIVEQEQITLQFLSDVSALDRLDELVQQLVRLDMDSMGTVLIQAQVASTTHRFADARGYLQMAATIGALPEGANRMLLSIDQACGDRLDAVLETRRKMAVESGRLEDLVPLGALLTDLREFDEADRIYQRALMGYQDVSPFALAWVCFQLGALWGELVPDTQSDRAAQWYRQAIEYIPSYVKARVHLSEIYLSSNRAEDAEALLIPAASSGDPEVHWRLADVMVAMGKHSDAAAQMHAARSGFEDLLQRYLLAFADHGAEFYSGSGDDPGRAFALASSNLENRATLRAFEQTYKTAIAAGNSKDASEILSAAKERCGGTSAFRISSLATQ